MKNWITIPIIFCLITTVTFAQNGLTSTITGNIQETGTGLPLIGATILIDGSIPVIGTTSDLDGNFKLNDVSVGRVNLIITYIGYEPRTISSLLLTSGKDLNVNVELEQSYETLDELVVTPDKDKTRAENKLVIVSARSFNVEETQRYAGGFYDPARMASNFAGVVTSDDEGNEIVIRGNNPTGMLWRLEGVEIPNPNHYSDGSGSSGGAISMISNKTLSNSDFLTGAFSAEFGNASSGVFDLNFRKGNTNKHEFSIQAGILGLQASAEGPLKKGSNSSYLVNYRYSTLTLLYKAGIWQETGSLTPEFQDINYKINIATKKAGVFTLFGFGGFSTAGEEANLDTSLWSEHPSLYYQENEKHITAFNGLSHKYLFKNKKTAIKTVLSNSYEYNSFIMDTLDYSLNEQNVYYNKFQGPTWRINTKISHKVNNRIFINGGAIYSLMSYNASEEYFDEDDQKMETILNDKGNTWYLQGFAQARLRLHENVVLIPGIHYTYLHLNQNMAVEPRLAVNYKLGKHSTLSYGFGLHSKVDHVSNYLAVATNENGDSYHPNKEVGFTKSIHNVIGIDRNFNHNFYIKLEAYYQHLYNVPVAADGSYLSAINADGGITNEKMVNEGIGKSMGIELTVEKYLSKGYYIMYTGSINKGQYTDLNGRWRNNKYSSTYISTLLGGKEWSIGKKKVNIIALNGKFMYRSGFNTIPVDLEASREAGNTVYDTDNAYETKAPDYFRFDMGISYRKNKNKYAWMLSLDIQNVTNRLNVYQEYYNPVEDKIDRYTYNGLLPIVNFQIDF